MFTLYRYIQYTPVVLIAIILIVSALLVVDWPEQKYKCDYSDSINITDGEKQPNSSILHNNILYDLSEYDEFDYIINKSGEKVKTDPYTRGCLCKKDGKECIRLCEHLNENMTNLLEHTLHDENNDSALVRLDQKFHILNEKICLAWEQELFFMNHTGHVLFYLDDELLGVHHSEYCLKLMNQTFGAYICIGEDDKYSKIRKALLPKVMFTSAGFIIVTIVVYVWFSEQRKLHGKCLICYMISLAIGYITLACIEDDIIGVNPYLCKIFGYTGYATFLSSFFWSSVIGFDLWSNFWKTHRFITSCGKKRFIYYSIFAGVLTLCFVATVAIVDNSSCPDKYKPGIGLEFDNLTYCFFNEDRKNNKIFYFYLPMFIIYIINTIFFGLTTWKIIELKNELKSIISEKESARKMKQKQDGYSIFFRIFIVMGVGWITEAIAAFTNDENSPYFLFTDILNCMQGVFLFACFVFKENVLRRMNKKLLQMFCKSSSTEFSFVTSTTMERNCQTSTRIPLHRIISCEEKIDSKQMG